MGDGGCDRGDSMNMKCPICGRILRQGERVVVNWIVTRNGGHWFLQHFRNDEEQMRDVGWCMQADLDGFFDIKATPEIAGSEQAE